MSENIDYKINVDTKDSVKNVNALTAANADLNEQLKIAKKNLSESIGETGVTSQKTQEAAFEVNNLTAQIKSNNVAIKEQSTVTKEAGATQGFFEKTMRSVTGNSTAYERAMKSMGVSVGVSDGLTKAIMFSTIAYDQAVTAITGKKLAETAAEEASAVAKTESTAATVAETAATDVAAVSITGAELATWAWNAALAVLLAPLTAFVAIVAAVATGVYFLVDAFDTEEASLQKLNKTHLESIAIHEKDIKQRKDLQKVYDHNNEQSIKLAKAKGLEGEALEKLELKYKSNEIAMAMMNAETQKGIFLSARKAVLDAKAGGADEDEIKTLKATYDKEYKTFTEFRDLVAVKSQEYRDIKSNADIDEANKERKLKDKKVKEEKEDPLIDKMRKGLEKLKEISASFEAEVELADKSTKDKEAEELEAHYQRLADLRLQDHQLTYEEDLKYWAKQADAAKAHTELKEELAETEGKIAEKAVGFLSAIAGKNKTLQKAAIIAESALGIGRSVIATNTANITATAEGAALAIPTAGASVATAAGLVTANYIALGLGTAANIAATAKALQAVGGGSAPSGGSGGGRSSGGGSVNASSTPQIGFQNSPENQIAKSVAKANQDMKVTVLASDITDVQNDLQTNVTQNSF